MRPERTSVSVTASVSVSTSAVTTVLRPSLASTQKALMSLIAGRDGDGLVLDADALVVGDARGSAEERVAVYANMYRLRIAEALESQFPRLAKWMGPDDFATLAAAYVDDHPSRHPSLRYIGARLPGWLDGQRHRSPLRQGLARLEWARTDVFDLADESTLTLDAVRSWSPERFGELPLRLIAAHRLLTVPVGTARLWDALGDEPSDDPGALPWTGVTESLIVWREGTVVYHRPVDEREHAALEQAAAGTQFGVLCESLLAAASDASEEHAIQQAYAWMSTWLADGLLGALLS